MSLSSPASWAADMNFQSRYPGGIVVTMTCLASLLSCPNDRGAIHATAPVAVTTATNKNAIRFIGSPFLLRNDLNDSRISGSTQRLERSPKLLRENLRLFPRREVAAFVELVVVDELGIR